jgi:hypothetical protein
MQFANNNGFNILVTQEGMQELYSSFVFSYLCVYLKDGTETKAFTENLREIEGEIIRGTFLGQETIDNGVEGYGEIFAIVAAGIVAVTALIVVIVL